MVENKCKQNCKACVYKHKSTPPQHIINIWLCSFETDYIQKRIQFETIVLVLPAVGLYSKKEEYSSVMLEACLLPEIFSKKTHI